jgi:hypothetical protein
VKRNYHTIEKQGKVHARKLGEFLSKSGQLLLPMVDLIEHCRMACDELIDVAGRATSRPCWSCRRSRWRAHASRASSGPVRWFGMASKPAPTVLHKKANHRRVFC